MPANVITTGRLALLFGVTTRHVLRLTDNGVLARRTDEDGKPERARYDLLPAVRGYCGYLRKQARLEDASESAFRRERNRKLAAEAEMVRLRLGLYKKQLHTSADVEFQMTLMLTALKSRLLALPARVSRSVIGKTNFNEIHRLLCGEIELALKELSTYSPSDFAAENEHSLSSVMPQTNGAKTLDGIPVSCLEEL
jgi:hypothetical protein